MTDEIVLQLRTLGLNEYEARVYATLVGLRRATARDIHEASKVPRGRIYEILHDLAQRGFVGVEDGSPARYHAVDPDEVIDHIRDEYLASLEKTRASLTSLSSTVPVPPPPFYMLRSDWAIENQIQSVFRKAKERMVLICQDPSFLRKNLKALKALQKRIDLYVLVSDREAFSGIELPLVEGEGIVADLLARQPPPGVCTRQECSILVDKGESIAVGSSGSERFAVIGSETPFMRYFLLSLIEHMGG
ncbi:MAG: helix-turn-helix domain-containing protein [Methanofollis sp.]|uniref:TrmB family transcriptional regulator n=1 Tax=Methanofollis sp. TaxID=2052835 RepID=UPI00261AAF35|nr:helix-turn-helix domain-containing protein [Methanofollis sp.]MDD4253933.1 helix-turn-helix domain-containing protein [Methanofollis sp.]